MSVKSPPLQLLRTFEIAGRHLSFKKTAEELCVTPSAVSQQIKILEDYLGVQLFYRTPRRLEFTDIGIDYFQLIQNAFRDIQKGMEKIHRKHSQPVLCIALLPFITNEFIIPNMHILEKNHPDIKLEMRNSYYVDFTKEAVDMCIHLGPVNSSELINEKLCDLSYIPVCSPHYLTRENILQLTDFNDKAFISMPFWSKLTPLFCEKLSFDPSQVKKGLILDSYSAILQATEQGLGFTIGVFPLIQRWIEAKRLVVPFTAGFQWEDLYLIYRKSAANRTDVQLFRSWIFELFNQLFSGSSKPLSDYDHKEKDHIQSIF